MAQKQRHLRGETNEVTIDVHGHTVIEKGDFVSIMNTNQLYKSTLAAETTADYYAYPMGYLAGVTNGYYDNTFLGIAMKGSASGVTEKIPVATTGVFRMPLVSQTGVTVTQLVAGTTSAAKTAYNQKVVSKTLAELTSSYFCVVGLCVKTASGATVCDFELVTRYAGVTLADWNAL